MGSSATSPPAEAYDDRYDRVFPLHVESVSATGGASADYEVSNEPGGITRIKIGDPDETISGVHKYTIVYTVDGGHERVPRPRRAVLERDRRPVGGAGRRTRPPASRRPRTISDATCYAGPPGATTRLRPAEDPRRDGPVHAAGLFPFEAFTVVVALPKGAVAEPHPQLVEPWSIGRAFSLTPVTLGRLRRAPAAADRRLRLALVDPRTRPPVRGLARRPDHGQPRPASPRRCRCSSAASPRWSSRRRRISGPGRSARSSTSRRTRSTSRRRSSTSRSAAT